MVLKKAKELWIVLLAKVLGARRAWIWGLWGSRGARGAPSPWEGRDPSFSQEEMLSWGGGLAGASGNTGTAGLGAWFISAKTSSVVGRCWGKARTVGFPTQAQSAQRPGGRRRLRRAARGELGPLLLARLWHRWGPKPPPLHPPPSWGRVQDPTRGSARPRAPR